MNNLAWFYFIRAGTSPLLYITVGIDEDDASSMHHLHRSIRLSYRTNAPARSTSVDRGGPWLSLEPRVDPIGCVFGSYEPIRSGGYSCVVVVVQLWPQFSNLQFNALNSTHDSSSAARASWIVNCSTLKSIVLALIWPKGELLGLKSGVARYT